MVRPCTFPGCHTLVLRGRCEKHAYPDRHEHNRKYNLKPWKDLREAKLRADPLCAEHLKLGQAVLANTVDHVDGDSNNDAWENLQSLCASCHSVKTARENRGFGNRPNGHDKKEKTEPQPRFGFA